MYEKNMLACLCVRTQQHRSSKLFIRMLRNSATIHNVLTRRFIEHPEVKREGIFPIAFQYKLI